MGRGPTIAAQKDKNAKAKAKIYTIHAKLISLAAEKGSDQNLNTSLADAIHSAKKDGVTADVIERAIKRGAGLDKDASKVEEIYYEGYAPGGVAIIVRTLTDNRNRTAPNIRHIFSAFGGSLGESGSVSNFAFEFGGQIHIETPTDIEAFELMILDTEATDYSIESDGIHIKTSREGYKGTLETIKQLSNIHIISSALGYSPKNYTQVTDMDQALKIYKMLDEFSQDEDVETVYNTADISDTLWQEVIDFVESRKFRT